MWRQRGLTSTLKSGKVRAERAGREYKQQKADAMLREQRWLQRLKQHPESSSQERAELNATVRTEMTVWVRRKWCNLKPPRNKHSVPGAMPRKGRKCPTTTETGNQKTKQPCKPSGDHFYWGTPRCNTDRISLGSQSTQKGNDASPIHTTE